MNYFDVYIYNDILCMKPIPSNRSSSPLLSPSSWPDSPDSKSITWALALGFPMGCPTWLTRNTSAKKNGQIPYDLGTPELDGCSSCHHVPR